VRNHQIKIIFALFGLAAAIAFAQGTPDGVVGKMGAIELKTAELRRILEAQPPQVKKQTGAQRAGSTVAAE
jgi:hypothetical protein